MSVYDRADHVYVIQGLDDGLVKIGYSRDPAARLAWFERNIPGGIVTWAVIKGSRATERWLHDRWAHRRVHGEWFEADQDLIDQAVQGRLLDRPGGLCKFRRDRQEAR